MEIKASSLSIHNRYTVQVIEKDTGEIVQEAYGFNKANSRRYVANTITSTPSFSYVWLGTGTGEETGALISPWKYASITWTAENDIPSFENKRFNGAATFTTSQGAINATEIAISSTSSSYSSQIYSHAFLVDVEGNPIVISKTETQELKITINLFFNATFLKDANKYGLKQFPENSSCLAGCTDAVSLPHNFFPIAGKNTVYFSGIYAPDIDESNSNFFKTGIQPEVDQISSTMSTSTGSESSFPIIKSVTNSKQDLYYKNNGFSHSIVFPGIGAISLPNEDIIPEYSYKNFKVGEGNGETTHFHPRLDEIVIEDSSFYLNDAPLSVGEYDFENQQVINGDVAFVNFDITKSPLWNKCAKIHYFHNHISESVDLSIGTNEKYNKSYGAIAMTNYPFSMNVTLNDTEYITGYKISPFYGYQQSSNFRPNSAPIYYSSSPITLDHIRVGKAVNVGNSNQQIWKTPSVEVQISDNGENWTTIQTSTSSFAAEQFYQEDGSKQSSNWWKLQISSTINGNIQALTSHQDFFTELNQDNSDYNFKGTDPKWLVLGNSSEYDFGKVGLNFVTPPAEGDLIIMDAALNLPYKDWETISFLSCSLSFPDPEPEEESDGN